MHTIFMIYQLHQQIQVIHQIFGKDHSVHALVFVFLVFTKMIYKILPK